MALVQTQGFQNRSISFSGTAWDVGNHMTVLVEKWHERENGKIVAQFVRAVFGKQREGASVLLHIFLSY